MKAIANKMATASLLLAMSFVLTACDSSSPGIQIVTPPPPAPPPAPVSFNQFVQDQFTATADDSDPESVDDVDFAFDEDPAAFDGLLQ